MPEFKVDFETASNELEIYFDEMDINVDEKFLDDADIAALNKHKSRLITAIQRGDLTFNSSGEAVLQPSHKNSTYTDPITFKERTGADVMATDNTKTTHLIGKMYAVLGSMCSIHPKTFTKLCGRDIKICESLFSLLMD